MHDQVCVANHPDGEGMATTLEACNCMRSEVICNQIAEELATTEYHYRKLNELKKNYGM